MPFQLGPMDVPVTAFDDVVFIIKLDLRLFYGPFVQIFEGLSLTRFEDKQRRETTAQRHLQQLWQAPRDLRLSLAWWTAQECRISVETDEEVGARRGTWVGGMSCDGGRAVDLSAERRGSRMAEGRAKAIAEFSDNPAALQRFREFKAHLEKFSPFCSKLAVIKCGVVEYLGTDPT